ncbi:6-phosphofructo-2-kinase family protein [Candida albicans]|uniref:6-phosphofructo-2-kinase family protein n=1 Tax=Candida albicans TaxID=5476 RepID=A0A8H6F5T4_CANAX|nr:6-phosphofructo-2-kinase family protein [Candida albicans]
MSESTTTSSSSASTTSASFIPDTETEILNGFGSAPISSDTNQLRTTKRWSFTSKTRPNMGDSVKNGPPANYVPKRRMSDITGIDAVHNQRNPSDSLGGAQLYSTESGRLFHAGEIIIILAGIPGRGKTHLSVSLTRYLRWLGVNTHSFHLGNYRRANAEDDITHDLFVPSPQSAKAHALREKMVNDCLGDILNFFRNDGGQVAIYDATNAIPEYRLELHKKFRDLNIQVIFIESLVTDDSIVMHNIEQAAKSSPDYHKWDYDKAYKDYTERIKALAPHYIEMGGSEEEEELSYIKFINFGERIELHNSNYGYLINKVVFYLMNGKIKPGSLYLARCYKNSKNPGTFKKKQQQEATPKDNNSLAIWTSVKRRTIETTQFFAAKNIPIRHRVQLSQKNPGITGTLTDDEIREKFPIEYAQYDHSPYHYRYPRAESYHDLAIKIEPLILEMERMSGDLLIIADETVLQVFYGYLMSCSCDEIPNLNFKPNEIVEVKFNAYSNSAKRIPIKDYS